MDRQVIPCAFAAIQQQTTVDLSKIDVEGNILHYILGTVTTVFTAKQLTNNSKLRKEYIETVGNLYWYLAGLCYELRIVFYPYVPSAKTNPSLFYDWALIEDRAVSILDYYRKYLAENQEFPSKVVEELIHEIFEYLVNILFSLEMTVEDCLKASVDRYKHVEKNPDIKREVRKELDRIKKCLAYHEKVGRPTKQATQEKQALTIGEEWDDTKRYKQNRKRKPGRRKNKLAWKRTLAKYERQKRERAEARSRQAVSKAQR